MAWRPPLPWMCVCSVTLDLLAAPGASARSGWERLDFGWQRRKVGGRFSKQVHLVPGGSARDSSVQIPAGSASRRWLQNSVGFHVTLRLQGLPKRRLLPVWTVWGWCCGRQCQRDLREKRPDSRVSSEFGGFGDVFGKHVIKSSQ